jgi:uncharacterized protein (DUF4415 family)
MPKAASRPVTRKATAAQRAKSGRARQQKEIAALAAMPEAAIDTSDAPQVGDWRGAKRGQFYRPTKQAVTIRLDADLIAWFKARETKYQTAVNRILREYMLRHL